MAKFCGKCGSKLDEATGLCPNCDADKLNKQTETPEAVKKPRPKQDTASEPKKPLSKKEAKKQRKADKKAAKRTKKKEKWASMTFGQKVRSVLVKLCVRLVLLVLLGASIVGFLSYYDVVKVPYMDDAFSWLGIENGNGGEQYTVEAPDAESFYEEKSTIISEIDANESDAVLTEKEAYNELTVRDFIEYPIETEYSMNGDYNSSTNISNTSTAKHPIYQTYYFSKNGEMWTIFLINGSIMANPVSFNVQSGLSVQVIVSEKDTVTSYDSTVNKFFETIPDKSALIVITVDKIDAETLDRLTIGEIGKYV